MLLLRQVFQSSDGVELLRGHAFERLDRSAPASPIGYWGLGGVARPRHWAPARYSSMVHFRKHKGKAHHAKLVHFKHNAALEREAAGFAPQDQQATDSGGLLRRHMKAGLFDKENDGAPMGTHFVTSPDHPQYVTGEEVAAPKEEHAPMGTHFVTSPDHPQYVTEEEVAAPKEEARAAVKGWAKANSFDSSRAKRAPVPVDAASEGHDLSESVASGDAMGTHFLTSPQLPAEQAWASEAAGAKVLDGGSGMGTHFITDFEHPEDQAEQQRAGLVSSGGDDAQPYVAVPDSSEMGTHFLESPDRPLAVPEAQTKPLVARSQVVPPPHVHSSDVEATEFGTHFIGSDDSFSARKKQDSGAADERAWASQSGVLSDKDKVGDSPYVVPREEGSEEGGVEYDNNVLAPEDRVGEVEYTSADDFASYNAGERDPANTFGPNTVQVRGAGEKAGGGAQGRGMPQSSDESQMPMGTNFVASKQGKAYSKEDVVGRAKPYSSDFPLPWSGTNSVFIGSHQVCHG